MIHVNFEDCANCAVACGITQWDYGQVLQISGLNLQGEVEVHYALKGRNCEAAITIAEEKEGILYSKIPDKLLKAGEDLRAYIYVADTESGETIKTIEMPVKRRQRPGDYSEPPEKNLLRTLIEDVNGKADSIKIDREGYLQLTSKGTPVGERIRCPTGSGREVEMRNNGTEIQWRYTDSNEWNTLALLDDLKGETPEFEIREGHLYAIYQN